ncbi:MAG: hypothetical protein MUF19_01830 [Candidatus Pacebacteria bacterium]|jgi:O-antigen/teichoic acid export membrane protein|nr:hypothetical protein [Candidatus Paceibacterota bacterium]
MVAFANLIDDHTLGIYQYMIAAISIVGAFSITGTHTAIIRAAGKSNHHAVRMLFRLGLNSTFIPVLIAISISSYYFYKGNSEIALGIGLGTVAYVSMTHLLRYNALFSGLQMFRESNIILKAKVVAPLILLLPALFFINSPAWLTILYFASSAIGMFMVSRIFKMRQFTVQYLKETTVESATQEKVFAIHQSIINLINILATHIDKIIIFQLLGAPATAAYYIAASIPDRIREMIKQYEPYVFSKFASHTRNATLRGVSFKFWFIVLIGISLSGIYCLLAPFFYSYIIPQYLDVLYLSIIYSMTIISGAAIVPYSALRVHASNRLLYYHTAIQSSVRIVLLFVGGWFWGLTGAIIGVTIAALANTVILLIITQVMQHASKPRQTVVK